MLDIIPVPVELGVPLPGKYDFEDLKRRVEAACATAKFLEEHGAEYPQLTQADKEAAAQMVAEYAEDSVAASKTTNIGCQTTQAIKYAKTLLDEYGHRAVESATQIRHFVTTKLIHEAENADPKVRLKALELLGKIADVGLFAERTEVTVTHQTSAELKDKLRAKLEKLVNPPKPVSQQQKLADADLMKTVAVTADDPDLNFDDVPLEIEGDYEEVDDAD